MSKIKNMWENYKAQLREKQAAIWMNFKSRLPEKIQSSLDKFEEKYWKKDILERLLLLMSNLLL